MRTLLAAALAAAAALASSFAAADPAPAAKTPDVRQMHTDDCAHARAAQRTCVIDMGKGESVNGSTPSGDGFVKAFIQINPDTSLIRLRRDFIVEILKTAEDL